MAELYDFQKDAVDKLLHDKNIIVAQPGAGKTAICLKWAENRATSFKGEKLKLLVITTAQKSHTTDWQDEADIFAPELKPKLESFEVLSWHMARKWCLARYTEEMEEYLVIFDELQKAKQGVSSLMGKSFLQLAKYCVDWVGATGTPGDCWLDFYPYFQATGKIRNKTQFLREFCIEQHYPFPKISAYIKEDTLRKWWSEISYTTDTATVMSQLPKERHQVITLPTPRGYKKVLRTNMTLDGEFLDSDMALLHELRQVCATKDKEMFVSDILQSLSSPIVIFYNYVCERNQILEVARKMKRKVWRIDGECHEIPTADLIGEKDVVLCHYLAGSEALNLQFCHYWLSYSYNYSYSLSLQAEGRIRRIGQKNPMMFYYLETEHTVEKEIKRALDTKQDFAEEEWTPRMDE